MTSYRALPRRRSRQLGYLGVANRRALGGATGTPAPIFSAPLTTSLIAVRGAGTPSFTRATIATVDDWEGLFKTVLSGEVRFRGARRVRNLASGSESTSARSTVAVTLTGAQVDVPTTGPMTSVNVAATNATWEWQKVVSGGGASLVLPSLYVKGIGSSIGKTINFVVTDNGGAGQGAVATITLTGAWQRITSTALQFTLGTDAFLRIFNSGGGSPVGSGDSFLVTGWQAEPITGQSNQNPGESVSVGVLSSPYHGASVDGVKNFDTQNGNTVAANVVTEAAGAAISTATLAGYLQEEARTNQCIWNRDFTNAAWVATTMTAAKDQTGIDGIANSASSLLATGANSAVKQTVTIAAVNRPFSVWMKRITGSGNIDLAQDGAAYTTQTLTGAWQRFTLVASQLNPILSIRIVTSGDKIAVDFAALEDTGGAAATFPSTPIATTTVAVTRNVDLLNYPLAGNANGPAGSCYAEMASIIGTTAAVQTAMASSGGRLYYTNATQSIMYDGTSITATPVITLSATPQKVGSVWGGTTMKCFVAGVAGTAAAFDGDMSFAGTLEIGTTAGTAALNGTIRNAKIWSAKLTDAQFAAL